MTAKAKSKTAPLKARPLPRGKAKPDATVAPPSTQAVRTPTGKLGVMAAMLREPSGATITTLMDATGWQAHSVRGALAGALKIKHGLVVTSQKTEAGRVYSAQADG